jgi:hypothetical protein
MLLVSRDYGWGYIHIAADIPPCTALVSSHDSAASAVAAAIAAADQLDYDDDIQIVVDGLLFFGLDELEDLRQWGADRDSGSISESPAIDWDEF